MKLSFLFELLLVLIIIAFAASKPVGEDNGKNVTSSTDIDPAKQSIAVKPPKPANDDDDDDSIFGFGSEDDEDDDDDEDEDDADEAEDDSDDLLGLDDDDDDRVDATNSTASSDEEFDQFVIFGEDIFASIFGDDDDDDKKTPNASLLAAADITPVSSLITTEKPVGVKNPPVVATTTKAPVTQAPILQDQPSLEEEIAAADPVENEIYDIKDSENMIPNLPPAPENLMSTVKVEIVTTSSVNNDNSDEDEGFIVISDDTQKLEGSDSILAEEAAVEDSEDVINNDKDMINMANDPEFVSVTPQSIPIASPSMIPVIVQQEAVSVPPPKVVTTKKPPKEEDDDLLEIVQELISEEDDDDSDLVEVLESDSDDEKETTNTGTKIGNEDEDDEDDELEDSDETLLSAVNTRANVNARRNPTKNKRWELISRHRNHS